MKKRITALLLALILSANMTGGIFADDAVIEEGPATEEPDGGEIAVTQPSGEDTEVNPDVVPLLTIDFADGDNGLTLENAVLEDDNARGQVLRIKGNGSGKTGTSYGLLETTVFADNTWTEGMTLAMWVKTDADSLTLKGSTPIFGLDIAEQGFFEVTASLEHACNSDGNDTTAGISPRLWADPANIAGGVNATAEGIWQHVALVYDAEGAHIYVDGELYSISQINNATMDILAAQLKSVHGLRLGSSQCEWWDYGDYEGKIDDVRLYNMALTQEELSALVEETKSETNEPDTAPEVDEEVYIPDYVLAVDFNNTDGGMTHVGTSLTQDDERGTVLEINGQGPGTVRSSYGLLETTVFEDNKWTDGLTLAMWIKTDEGSETLSGTAPIYSLDICAQGYISAVSSMQFACNSDGNDTSYGINPRVWADPINIGSSTHATQEGVWQHFVTVFTPDDGIKLYLDGELVLNRGVNGGTMDDLLFQIEFVHALRLGSWACQWWDYGDYEGRIDDVMLFNYALNQTSVKELANYNLENDFLPTPSTGGAGDAGEVTTEAVKLSSTDNAYGTESYSEGTTYDMAFDGVKHTFYDGAHTNASMHLGIKLDSPAQLTEVRIHPRIYANEFDVGEGIECISATAGYVYDDVDENAHNLFDGTADTVWCGDFVDTAEVIWTMYEPITITGYSLAAAMDADTCPERIPVAWTLYGMNDDDSFTEIDSRSGESSLVKNPYGRTIFTVSENTAAYQKYKLVITDLYGVNINEEEDKSCFALSSLDLINGEYYTGDDPYYRIDAWRLCGLVVEGSVTGNTWETLYRFEEDESLYSLAEIVISADMLEAAASQYSFTKFRIRNLTDHLEAAEIEFYGIENSTLPTLPTEEVGIDGIEAGSVLINDMTDTEVFGSAAYSENATYDMAFDGDPSTFYDAANDNPVEMNVGMTITEPMRLTGIRFVPRNDGMPPEITVVEADFYEHHAPNLFDYNPRTIWMGDMTAETLPTVVWEMPEATVLSGYMITNSDRAGYCTEQIPTGWTLYGSNDLETWTQLDKRENDETLVAEEHRYLSDDKQVQAPYVIEFATETEAFRYFKLTVESVYGMTEDGETDASIAALSGVDILGTSENYDYHSGLYIPNPERVFSLVLEGSTDGEAWEVLYDFGGDYYPAAYNLIGTDELKPMAGGYSYTMFRLRHTISRHLELAELELYGVIDDTVDPHPGKIPFIKDETYAVIEEVAPDAAAAAYGDAYPGSVNFSWPEVTSGKLLKGTIISGLVDGSYSWGDNPSTSAAAVFDGSCATFYDPVDASLSSWAGMMLSDPCELTEVRVAPREAWVGRLAGFAVQGSNDGENWDTIVYLSGVDEAPAGYEYHCFTPEPNENYIEFYASYGIETPDMSEYWVGGGAYLMFRAINLENNHNNFAEIELYGSVPAWKNGVDYVVIEEVSPDNMADAFGENYPGSLQWSFPEVTSGELLTGTIIAGYNGEQHCWRNDETGEQHDNASYVFDGDIDTYFDPFESGTGSWAGIILDDTYELTEIRIIPRNEWLGRMSGIAVQGSNDGIVWDTIVYLTGVDEAPAGWEYHCFTPETNEEYMSIYADEFGVEDLDLSEYWIGDGAYQIYRCVNLSGNHGNFAEIELYGNYVNITPCDHELTYVEGVKKTCTTDGNIEHWHCELCGRNYADENGYKRLRTVVVPASHTLTGVWETNKNEHWQACKVCGDVVEDTRDTHWHNANCTAAIHCETCDMLLTDSTRTTWEEGMDYVMMDKVLEAEEKGDLYGENYPASSLAYGWGEAAKGELLQGEVIAGFNGVEHNWNERENEDSAEKAFDGNIHTYFDPFIAEECSWVGMIMEEGYQLTEVRIMPREDWLERMVGGAVQGSNDGINWVNIVYLTGVYECPAGFDFHCFTPETNAEYTAKYDKLGAAEPDMSTYWVNTDGVFKYFRYVNLEGIHGNVGEIELYGIVPEVIPEHVHVLSYVAEKADTCSASGNIAHWHCDSCGLNYKDEEATVQIEKSVVVNDITGHDLKHVDPAAATCTVDGHTEYFVCTICNTKFAPENTIIKAPGHDWGDGWVIVESTATRTCRVCGNSETKEVKTQTVAVTNENTAAAETNKVDVNVIGDNTEAVVVISEKSLNDTLDILGAGSGADTDTSAAGGNITIDVGSAVENTEIKEVTIPTSALTSVAAAAASEDNATEGLEVKLTTGSVVFDATALNAIASANAKSANVELKIEKIASDDSTSVAEAASAAMTTDAQNVTLEAMEKDEEVTLLDAVDLTAGDVHELGSKATIRIPFDASDVDMATQTISMTYIHEDGSVETIEAEYEDGYLVFEVDHFSVFIVTVSKRIHTFSGTVVTGGKESQVTVELTPKGSDVPVYKAQGRAMDFNFKIEGIIPGTYTVRYIKGGHFTSVEEIVIDEDIELENPRNIYLIGDVASDKVLNEKDVELMQRYFKGENVSFNTKLADADGDNAFTRRDMMIISRNLAGWGYNLPYTVRG